MDGFAPPPRAYQAYDSVWSEGLWCKMRHCGVENTFADPIICLDAVNNSNKVWYVLIFWTSLYTWEQSTIATIHNMY